MSYVRVEYGGESTCREFKHDHNCHDSPHCIFSKLLKDRVQEVQKWNQNQGDSYFDAVNHLPGVLVSLHLLVSGIESNGNTVDFIFPKIGKLECFVLFGCMWEIIFFSICNGYYVSWFHFVFTLSIPFPFLSTNFMTYSLGKLNLDTDPIYTKAFKWGLMVMEDQILKSTWNVNTILY